MAAAVVIPGAAGDASVDTPKYCTLCNKPTDTGKSVTIGDRGVETLRSICNLRGDQHHFFVGQQLHTDCRRDYTNKNKNKKLTRDKNREQCTEQIPKFALSSEYQHIEPFVVKRDCILCGEDMTQALRKRNGRVDECHRVQNRHFVEAIKKKCSERSDVWCDDIIQRMESLDDVQVAGAQYHKQCHSNFMTEKSVPRKRSSASTTASAIPSKKGRPSDEEKTTAFLKVAQYLKENNNEQLTIRFLHQKMREFLKEEGKDTEPFCEKTLRKKLEDHFGEEVIMTNFKGKTNVVTLRSTAETILRHFAEEQGQEDQEAKKQEIITTAAKLILSDIKNMTCDREAYPSQDDIADLDGNMEYLPSSLKLFMETLLERKKDNRIRVASIGQAIVQATRPYTVITPLLLGLGVEVHHRFGCRDFLEQLHKHGFAVSYPEVRRYELSASVSEGVQISGITPTSSLQFVADNVDHDTKTLTGEGTFHGMGMIAAVTPAKRCRKLIPRLLSATTDHAVSAAKVPIKFYSLDRSRLQLEYGVLQNVGHRTANPLDLLWKLSWPLRSPRPSWCGTMQAVCHGNHPGQTSLTFLPMIDLDPTDPTCIYSTMHYVSSLAWRYGFPPILTFDQPLWWKARTILELEPENSPLKKIILRLGGFHTEMSFLGCIGKLMGGSGLQEVLEVIYAANSVPHLMSGKAVARAVRGHILVDAVLNSLLAIHLFNIPVETDAGDPKVMTEDGGNDLLQTALTLYDQVMDGTVQPEDLHASCPELATIQSMITQAKADLADKKTPRLWLQYMTMVDILKQLLRAERTGNWKLHLQTLQEMLPYLAAAGHNQYTKSVYIYVQDMIQLREKDVRIFRKFVEGHHVLRRSDRFWAGLPPDLVIEQSLMRMIKTATGLTRGRGLDEAQRAQWVLSMPACASINSAMQEVTGMDAAVNDQHTDSSPARQKKDDEDMRALLSFLLSRNPFTSAETSLRNIVTGMVADSTVNADEAEYRGRKIVDEMAGKKVMDHKFTKKNQAVTMATKRSIKIEDEHIQVDPQLLFQRLLTAAVNRQSEDVKMTEVFEYELSVLPASLFEPSGLMRDAGKSRLTDSFPQQTEAADMHEGCEFVLDGGSLLYRLSWKKGEKFQAICDMYAQHVTSVYGKSATVVFDGYLSGPSTKDHTHMRRCSVVGPEIKDLKASTVIGTRKDVFMSNSSNKQALVNMLGEVLKDRGCRVLHAAGDADTLIVKTALERAETSQTIVIGEDTDLLVLLCYHTTSSSRPITLRSDRQGGKMWHIQHLQQGLSPDVCQALPFLHAVNGSDTTSRLYGIGKGVPLKKFKVDPTFRSISRLFSRKNEVQDNIMKEGEKALVSLFNGKRGQTLNNLRYQRYYQKTARCSTAVQVQTLPPTSDAAKFHSLRTYLQVQEWVTLEGGLLQPEQWGWQKNNGQLEPRTSDKAPAPDYLLKVIYCRCKGLCKPGSGCNCRKYGLECSVVCGECKGLSCLNSPKLEEVDPNSVPDVLADIKSVLPVCD